MTNKSQVSESNIYSRDTEQMVIGCLLSSASSFKNCFEKNCIESTDFYYLEHQTIFGALKALYHSGSASDVLLVTEQLKRTEKLQLSGGVGYLVDLAGYPGTSAHFESYFQLLKDISSRREFVSRCEELKKLALGSDKDIASMAALATTNFSHITKKTLKKKSHSLATISKGEGRGTFLDALQEKRRRGLSEGKWKIPGIPTGFSSLDNVLGGLRDENFVIVAARPSVGKTAFALNLLRYLGVNQKIPVAFFSLEMTANQLFLRLISAQSGISASDIEIGKISDTQMEQIETALQQLEGSPIFINDSCYAISNIIAQMRALIDEHQVRAFFIDYVGLIQPAKEREIKAYEIGDITRSLKNFSNEMHVPIVCLAQLNRQAEQNNRPQLSMLKDSGNLEQDADSVIFLHRRDLYDSNDKPGQIEVIIAKNRHGATDTKSFQFDKEIGVISEHIDQTIVSWN